MTRFFHNIESLEQVRRKLFINGAPVVNMDALAKEEFKYAGELMSMSIVQGGPAPCFFRNCVYLYMAKGVDGITADIAGDVVEDLHFKDVISKVNSPTTRVRFFLYAIANRGLVRGPSTHLLDGHF